MQPCMCLFLHRVALMKTAVLKYEQVCNRSYAASIYQIAYCNELCVGGGWME